MLLSIEEAWRKFRSNIIFVVDASEEDKQAELARLRGIFFSGAYAGAHEVAGCFVTSDKAAFNGIFTELYEFRDATLQAYKEQQEREAQDD